MGHYYSESLQNNRHRVIPTLVRTMRSIAAALCFARLLTALEKDPDSLHQQLSQ